MAVKSAKKEIKEQAKRSELKMTDYEKKIFELMEYKKEKLAEERTLRLKHRKELKKAKKEHTKDILEDKIVNDKEDQKVETDFNSNIPVSNAFEVLDSVSEDSPSQDVFSTTTKNALKSKITTSEDLEDEKDCYEDSDSNEELNNESAQKSNFPDKEDKHSHLKPEDKAVIEQYKQILQDTIAKAVAAVETKII